MLKYKLKKGFPILRQILTTIVLSSTLFASSESLPTRIDIALDEHKRGMLLLDHNHTKVVSKEFFLWIRPFVKVNEQLLAKAKNLEGKVGFIDPQGQWIVAPTLDSAKNFSNEGIARVEKDEKWGYIKPDGSWLVKPTFNYVLPFIYGFGAVILKKEEATYVDREGKLLPQRFAAVNSFCSNGLASVAIHKKVDRYEISLEKSLKSEESTRQLFWGQIDKEGKVVHPFTLERGDKALLCPKVEKPKDSSKKEFVAKVRRKYSGWVIEADKEKYVEFPKEIVAPIIDAKSYYAYGFIDGLVAMIDSNRTLQYFDGNGTNVLSFHPNSNAHYALFHKDKEIYESRLNAFSIYCDLGKGIPEHFIDKSDYNASNIVALVKSMLAQEFRRYKLPNMVYESRDDNVLRDPYEIIGESDSVEVGVVKILARSYVDEEAWGSHEYLSDFESRMFSSYSKTISAWISKVYGKPIEAKWGRYVWKIGEKYLKLDTHSDTGDGDFYHLLALEVYKGEE